MNPIYLITGVPGSGKSSVAASLMRRFPFGIHVPVDDLREWVVSGMAHPVPDWTEETTRQFQLARKSAAQIAHIYAQNGFAVGIDDVLFPDEARRWFVEPLLGFTVRMILLEPSLEAALARNAVRENKRFDTSLLTGVIERLYGEMAHQDFAGAGWTEIDNSRLSVEETVDEILRRSQP